MKCNQCVREGKRSKVFQGMTSSTLMGGGGPYYDEDGSYHRHDPNTISTTYKCSNGHKWVEKSKHSCPGCDYGGPIEETT